MNNHLHIITLNIPYPPDYGGMIDTFYRIRALHNAGIRIHLHCFEYGRQHSTELESLCETTSYYRRESGFLRQLATIPYIVITRKSEKLLNNLTRDDYPILFDGLHSTYYIGHPALAGRRKLVRLHNIEYRYYHTLAENETDILKKIFFLLESARLKRYEKVLLKADHILSISESDQEYFGSKYHNSVYLSPFHPFSGSKSLQGTGEYIIYHGDLSIRENSAMADTLIPEVFSKIPYKCIIAGKDPPEYLRKHASRYDNIKVISNPGNDQMEDLIANAHINLLPALANNGFKLKLLIALYAGRHCVVNPVVGENTPVKQLCHIVNTGGEMAEKVMMLMKEPFTEEIISERKRILSEYFDVERNAKKIIELLNGESTR
jgi:hypothetical protein